MAQRRTKAGGGQRQLLCSHRVNKQPTRWLLLRVPLFSCACFICHARLHGTLLSELEWQRCEEADQCIFNHNKLQLWGQPRPFAKEENILFSFLSLRWRASCFTFFKYCGCAADGTPPTHTDTHTTSLDVIKKENLIRVPMWFQITILAFFFSCGV